MRCSTVWMLVIMLGTALLFGGCGSEPAGPSPSGDASVIADQGVNDSSSVDTDASTSPVDVQPTDTSLPTDVEANRFRCYSQICDQRVEIGMATSDPIYRHIPCSIRADDGVTLAAMLEVPGFGDLAECRGVDCRVPGRNNVLRWETDMLGNCQRCAYNVNATTGERMQTGATFVCPE